MADLIEGLGDRRGDPGGAQPLPVGAGGVGLVAEHRVRSGARSSRADAGHAEPVEPGRAGSGSRSPAPRSPAPPTADRPSSRAWTLLVAATRAGHTVISRLVEQKPVTRVSPRAPIGHRHLLPGGVRGARSAMYATRAPRSH